MCLLQSTNRSVSIDKNIIYFQYRCVICNTSFETAQLVKEHITTHLTGLPFPCEKCDYSFETSEQLEEHELKHAEMEYEEQIEKEVIKEALTKVEVQNPLKKNKGTEVQNVTVTEYTIDDFTNDELSVVPRKKSKISKGNSNKTKCENSQLQESLGQLPEKTSECIEETHPHQLNLVNANLELLDQGVHAGNYVPFLKDEVDSDVEEMGIPEEAIQQGEIFF